MYYAKIDFKDIYCIIVYGSKKLGKICIYIQKGMVKFVHLNYGILGN